MAVKDPGEKVQRQITAEQGHAQLVAAVAARHHPAHPVHLLTPAVSIIYYMIAFCIAQVKKENVNKV